MSDSLRFVQDLLLGGTSGVIAKTCCAPLERIKIILQVQSANTSGVKVCKNFFDSLDLFDPAFKPDHPNQIITLIL